MSKFLFTSETSNTISGTVAKQFPFFGEGKPVYFWAEQGLVKFQDERDHIPDHERYGVMDWRVAAQRVLALSGMIIRSSEDRRWGKERKMLQEFLCQMEQVIREAKEQGGPFDGDAVRRDYKRRRPVSVVMPKEVDLSYLD